MLKSDQSFHKIVFCSAVLCFVLGPIYADILGHNEINNGINGAS